MGMGMGMGMGMNMGMDMGMGMGMMMGMHVDVEDDDDDCYDSLLTAYWESGDCGAHGNDFNWDWCGRQAGECAETVSVDSSLCASGTAVLEVMSGDGSANSYTRDDCNYFYHAQYLCAEDAGMGMMGMGMGMGMGMDMGMGMGMGMGMNMCMGMDMGM